MMILSTTPVIMALAVIPAGTYGNFWDRPYDKSASRSGPTTANRDEETTGVVNGWVAMEGRMDLRSIVSLVQDVPEIKRILSNLTNKVDTFDKELILATIIPHLSDQKGGEYEVNGLIKETIQSLYNSPLDHTQTDLLKALEFLSKSPRKPVKCDLVELMRGFDIFGHTIQDNIAQMQGELKEKLAKEDQAIVQIHSNNKILLRIAKLLEEMPSKSRGMGGSNPEECPACTLLKNILEGQGVNSKALKQLIKALQNIGILKNPDGGSILDGIRGDIQRLLSTEDNIKATLGQVSALVEDLVRKGEKFFSMQQRVVVETQYSLAETAKHVQLTATTAQEAVKQMVREASKASRSLRDQRCK